jgi:polysaccharide biosynthesis protein PslH
VPSVRNRDLLPGAADGNFAGMNVLIVTAYPPVLQLHGGGVRMFHNIRILAQKHSVHLISFVGTETEREMLRPVGAFCETVTAVRRVPDFRPHWLSVQPFLVREFHTREMHQAVDKTIRSMNIDVLQCEYLAMAQYWRPKVFTILTIHETSSPNADEAFRRERDPVEKFRLYYRWMSTLRYEVLQSRLFDRVVAMTEHDADFLRTYSPDADIRSIPIGVDTAEFVPSLETPDENPHVLFVGNFRHAPNAEAAEFLINSIAPELPDLKFVISGPHLARQMAAGANVVITGYVEDTRILHCRPDTIVATPLFSGTGQRVKLLEAFAMGCPVVTSSIGAMGYPVHNGVEVLLADSVPQFVAALRQLASSRELRRQLGQNAREMILRHFDWQQLSHAYLSLIDEAHAV